MEYGFQCAVIPPFGKSGITDCQGPYASGNSRHCAPLRAIQSIPLSIFRSSFRGRPRFPVLSGGSTAFTRSHCSFVNSYRFMPLFYTSLSCMQYLFFKQGLVLKMMTFPLGRACDEQHQEYRVSIVVQHVQKANQRRDRLFVSLKPR